uniref:Senescence regulator n=1 Tax=Kalanchoe fedtschenkoi TaxID=63787 RepID=A0A7N0V2F9_KALFE
MDFGGRHQRKSPSSDRFLAVFSPPPDSSIVNNSDSASAGDELNEDDVFWTGDFAQNKAAKSPASSFNDRMFLTRSPFGKKEDKFGILAALSDESKVQALRRKPSFSPSAAKNVLAIPKPPIGEREILAKTAPAPKFNFSAPVNVPMLSKEMMKANARRNKAFFDAPDDDDQGGDDEMLPPHEIVARGSALTPNTTFSMLEGAGRTLKGRDLRQVRNAVFRQTGFLD